METQPIYDRIGKDFSQTRRADPRIVDIIISQLRPVKNAKYLDLACGTGNYTSEIKNRGLNIIGVDRSRTMIDQAKLKHPDMIWQIGSGEDQPFSEGEFNGITIQNAIQYFSDLGLVLRECFRVISFGRLVIFTPTREQLSQYWLNYYFPKTMKKAIEQMPETQTIYQQIREAGFQLKQPLPFFIPPDLEDLFLYSGKQRPYLYLNDAVRNNIGAFALSSEHKESNTELSQGLERLKDDINSRKIKEIIERHPTAEGDCLFIVGEKQ